MKKISKTTFVIFIVSFLTIYVKFIKIEDQLFGLGFQTLHAKTSTNANKEKITPKISGNKTNSKAIDSKAGSASYNAKNQDIKFATLPIGDIDLETARQLLSMQIYNKGKFEKKALDDISVNTVDHKIEQLQLLVKELREVQKSIQQELASKNKLESENIDNLVQVIEGMSAKQASIMFSGLNLATRVMLVKKMDKAKLSSIVSLLDPKISIETFENALKKG